MRFLNIPFLRYAHGVKFMNHTPISEKTASFLGRWYDLSWKKYLRTVSIGYTNRGVNGEHFEP
jgi:hypothetical protein